jgi:hypothetical protein
MRKIGCRRVRRGCEKGLAKSMGRKEIKFPRILLLYISEHVIHNTSLSLS